MTIRPVADARWNADLRDVQKVLDSTAQELWRFFPQKSLEPILVEPQGGPIVLYRRGPNGEIIVRLDTGGTYWSQYAFQFAHEFCHILCGYKQDANPHRWFEEAICETASLFTLRRMAVTWKTDPPYAHWDGYASALGRYARRRLHGARLPENLTLAAWYRRHAAHLHGNPYLRRQNRVVAAALLPLLEQQPEDWEAVAYFNCGNPSNPQIFPDHLENWRRHAPVSCRDTIAQIAERLGIRLSPGHVAIEAGMDSARRATDGSPISRPNLIVNTWIDSRFPLCCW